MSFLTKIIYECKKHSPEILMGLGIGGAVTGAVLIGRASYKKLPEVIEKHDDRMCEIDTESKSEVSKEVAKTTLEVAKIYAVPVTVEAASLVCILASNQIMRKRAAGLAAAFTTVSTAFEQYRQRVKERYGEEVERSIYLGETQIEVGEVDKKGKVKKETITVADPSNKTLKYMIQGEHPDYTDDERLMQYMMELAQANINDKLHTSREGFVTLNKMYEEINFRGTQSGLVIGKINRPNDPNNFITILYGKTKIPNEDGDLVNAWWIDFEGLELIYGNINSPGELN